MMPSAQRSQPPAVSLQTAEAKTVLGALIDAHARMYDALKQADTVDADGDGKASWVGVVYPLVPVTPANPKSTLDQQAAKNLDYLWNRVYLNAVALGKYDANLDGNTTVRADLAGRMDYIGINWYSGLEVTGVATSLLAVVLSALHCEPSAAGDDAQTSPTSSPRSCTRERRPGQARDHDRERHERRREHAGFHRGKPQGSERRHRRRGGRARVLLLDPHGQLRVDHGMDIRMGLYAVDKGDPTKARVARPAVAVYGQIAQSGVLDDAVVAKWAGDAGGD